jgi:hypothetical protein
MASPDEVLVDALLVGKAKRRRILANFTALPLLQLDFD